MRPILLFSLILFCSCQSQSQPSEEETILPPIEERGKNILSKWQRFLKDLPLKNGPIIEYNGSLANDQSKHFQLVNYDVGKRDLQQCADFLIRLRAEYLFAAGRKSEIAFRFTSGQDYSYEDYLAGKRPVVSGNSVVFRNNSAPANNRHASLRAYLDHVYAYAGTVSLQRDLHDAGELEIGTIIISAGTPGHCMIIIADTVVRGIKKYKLAESYMPAQTPYVLKNKADGSPWHVLELNKPIVTASYSFYSYRLKRFE